MDFDLQNNIRSYNILGLSPKTNDELIYFLDSLNKSAVEKLVILGAVIDKVEDIHIPNTNDILVLRTALKVMYKKLLHELNGPIKITDLMFISDRPFVFNQVLVDEKLEITSIALLSLAKVINLLGDEYIFDTSLKFELGLDACTMKDLTLVIYASLGLQYNFRPCTEILLKCIEEPLLKLQRTEIVSCYDNMIQNYHALSDEIIASKLKHVYITNISYIRSKVEYLFFGLKRILGLEIKTNKMSKEISISDLPKHYTPEKLRSILNITDASDIKVVDANDSFSGIITVKKDTNLEDKINELIIVDKTRYFPHVQKEMLNQTNISNLLEDTRERYINSLTILDEILAQNISHNIDEIWDIITNMYEIVMTLPLFVELLDQRKLFKNKAGKLIDKLVEHDIKRFNMDDEEAVQYKKMSLIEKLRLRNRYLN